MDRHATHNPSEQSFVKPLEPNNRYYFKNKFGVSISKIKKSPTVFAI